MHQVLTNITYDGIFSTKKLTKKKLSNLLCKNHFPKNISMKNNSLLKQFSGQSQPFFIFNATSRRFSSEYFASSSLLRLNFFSLFFTFIFFCIFTIVFVFFTLLFFFTFFVGDAFFLMVSSSEVTLSVVEASPGWVFVHDSFLDSNFKSDCCGWNINKCNFSFWGPGQKYIPLTTYVCQLGIFSVQRQRNVERFNDSNNKCQL